VAGKTGRGQPPKVRRPLTGQGAEPFWLWPGCRALRSGRGDFVNLGEECYVVLVEFGAE
jgi:hypothetical protein